MPDAATNVPRRCWHGRSSSVCAPTLTPPAAGRALSVRLTSALVPRTGQPTGWARPPQPVPVPVPNNGAAPPDVRALIRLCVEYGQLPSWRSGHTAGGARHRWRGDLVDGLALVGAGDHGQNRTCEADQEEGKGGLRADHGAGPCGDSGSDAHHRAPDARRQRLDRSALVTTSARPAVACRPTPDGGTGTVACAPDRRNEPSQHGTKRLLAAEGRCR